MLNHPNYSWSSRLAARCFETSLPPDLPSLTTVAVLLAFPAWLQALTRLRHARPSPRLTNYITLALE